jgi:hypothetical protein
LHKPQLNLYLDYIAKTRLNLNQDYIEQTSVKFISGLYCTASLYCQHLPTEKLKDKQGKGAEFAASVKGTKYMVIDLGGLFII